jgi:hypothetical protein
LSVRSIARRESGKYVFLGRDLAGDPAGVVAKIGAAGKAVVLTVYREETS